MYNIQSHRFQKLDEILQDEIVAATLAGRSFLILVCSHRLEMCSYSLHLLDQEIFSVPSPEPAYPEQSMVTKQQIHIPI